MEVRLLAFHAKLLKGFGSYLVHDWYVTRIDISDRLYPAMPAESKCMQTELRGASNKDFFLPTFLNSGHKFAHAQKQAAINVVLLLGVLKGKALS